MFIEINGVTYNINAILSFAKVDKKVQTSDYSYIDKFFIVYSVIGGITVDEEFDFESERDEKYNILRSRLLMEDFRDEEENESNEENNGEENIEE